MNGKSIETSLETYNKNGKGKQNDNDDDLSNHWIVWMLADSALPTGGFIFSSGLESAVQNGHIRNQSQFIDFIHSSSRLFAISVLPFFRESFSIGHDYYEKQYREHVHQRDGHDDAHACTNFQSNLKIQEEINVDLALQPNSIKIDHHTEDLKAQVQVQTMHQSPLFIENQDSSKLSKHLIHSPQNEELSHVKKLIELDLYFDSFNSNNHVTKRASKAQGASLLTLISKGFYSEDMSLDQSIPEDSPLSHHEHSCNQKRKVDITTCELIKTFKRRQRRKEAYGHYPIVFGLLISALGIEKVKGEHLFLFMHIRSIISAAVRLNLIGPYAGHQILHSLRKSIDHWIQESHQISSIDQVYQPMPILDIIQGMHDSLYSRMFHN